MVTSATGAILVGLATIEVPRPTVHGPGLACRAEAILAVARTPRGRAIMVIVASVTHGLTLRSDACATARASATDAVLVLMATTCLPAALGAPTTMAARVPRLGTRARRASGPTARVGRPP